jgi:hypothetical protein
MVVRFEKRATARDDAPAPRLRSLTPVSRPLTAREVAHREQMLRFLASVRRGER